MKYRMIALDLDGTLLGRNGKPSARNLAAIGRAREAGVMIVPCTGRGWRESLVSIRQFPPAVGRELGVFACGSVVCELATGQSVDLAALEPHLAMRLVEHLRPLPEAVLVFQDASLAGHDYLVTGSGSINENTQWWFEITGATVRFARDIQLDDLHHVLRVGIVAPPARLAAVVPQIQQAFGDDIFVQSFEAVRRDEPAQSMHVLELFAPGVDKWRGLLWIAQQHDIDPAHIATIGDQINDVTMIQQAGCGIAMANAIHAVKDVADHITLDCDQDGVAFAIDQLLAGRWGS